MLFAVAGLARVLVSVTGNETAQRCGRRRVVMLAMTIAAALSLAAGWTAAISKRSQCWSSFWGTRRFTWTAPQ
jgi:MFS family permease